MAEVLKQIRKKARAFSASYGPTGLDVACEDSVVGREVLAELLERYDKTFQGRRPRREVS